MVINICESNPTYKAGYIIHQVLKNMFFDDFEIRRGVYKTIKYRPVEAHVVRTIVKPYIRDMNLKWSKMTAVDKLRTCDFKKQPDVKRRFMTVMELSAAEDLHA